MADAGPRPLQDRLTGLDPAQRADLVTSLRAARRARPVPATPPVPYRPAVSMSSAATGRPVFLVHPSGGSVLPYGPLVAALDGDVPCWGLQAAGLAGEPSGTVEALVEHCLSGLRSVQPAGPYRLVGWSTGGVLAFATALRLQAAGERTGVLAVLDSEPPPQLAEPTPVASVLALFAADFAQALDRPPVPLEPAELAGLPPAAQLDRVLARLAEHGLMPPEQAGEVGVRARIFVATVRAGSTWRPDRWDGRIDLLLSDEAGDAEEAVAGWQRLTTGPVVARRVHGDHYAMMRPPHVSTVAAVLTEVLAGGHR